MNFINPNGQGLTYFCHWNRFLISDWQSITAVTFSSSGPCRGKQLHARAAKRTFDKRSILSAMANILMISSTWASLASLTFYERRSTANSLSASTGNTTFDKILSSSNFRFCTRFQDWFWQLFRQWMSQKMLQVHKQFIELNMDITTKWLSTNVNQSNTNRKFATGAVVPYNFIWLQVH